MTLRETEKCEKEKDERNIKGKVPNKIYGMHYGGP
jgi:hypothetical protein